MFLRAVISTPRRVGARFCTQARGPRIRGVAMHKELALELLGLTHQIKVTESDVLKAFGDKMHAKERTKTPLDTDGFDVTEEYRLRIASEFLLRDISPKTAPDFAAQEAAIDQTRKKFAQKTSDSMLSLGTHITAGMCFLIIGSIFLILSLEFHTPAIKGLQASGKSHSSLAQGFRMAEESGISHVAVDSIRPVEVIDGDALGNAIAEKFNS